MRAALLLAIALACPRAAAAQGAQDQLPPAHIDVVAGDVTLDRDGERLTADAGMPVVPGDRLSTTRGRSQLLFPDGSVLALDEFTDLSMESPSLWRLRAGRLLVTTTRDARDVLQIDTPTGTAHIDAAGDYRLAVMGGASYAQTELAVARGYAELEGDRGSAKLRAGERSVAWPNDLPSRPQPFDSARADAFARWVGAQREDRTGRSVQYLPPDLRGYSGTLDRYGTWGFEGGFGYVWYPEVAAGWRPYYSGYWASVGPYGWTWIGAERWAWATHHYGRWGYMRDRWFWIPDRRWAPAWVAWGTAPGYVGWSPLGFDNRPLFDFSLAAGIGSGWTVLPRARFGGYRVYADRYAVAPGRLPARTALSPSAPPARLPRAAAGQAAGAAARRDRVVPRVAPADRGNARRDPAVRNPRAADRVPSARPPGSAAPPSAPRSEGGAIAAPRPGGDTASPNQRRYPFGDFRRSPDGLTPPAPEPADGSATETARPPRRPAREAAPRESAPPDQPQQPGIYLPPPSPAGAARPPRGEPNRGGTISGRPGAAAPRRGGDRGGSVQGQQGGRAQPQQGGRSDGRAHDPGSRRPR